MNSLRKVNFFSTTYETPFSKKTFESKLFNNFNNHSRVRFILNYFMGDKIMTSISLINAYSTYNLLWLPAQNFK